LFGLIPAGIIPPFPPNPFGPSIILSTLHTAWQRMDRTASRTPAPFPSPSFVALLLSLLCRASSLAISLSFLPFHSACVLNGHTGIWLIRFWPTSFPLLGIHWPLGSVSRPFPPLDLRYKCLFSLFLPPSSSCPALEESAVNFRANSLQKWGIGTHKNKAAALALANDDD
jgi:hypothetical protein